MTEPAKNILDIVPLQHSEDFALSYIKGSGPRLVISLAGVGTQPDVMPPYEFIGTASEGGQNHVLLVSERARTWFNDTRLEAAILQEINAIKARHDIQEVVTIGNSMGAFMGIVLAQLIKVDRVIAFSPQYSMHPELVPDETRWRKWRNRIAEFRHPHAGDMNSAETSFFLFHGDAEEEIRQWRHFPVDRRLHHFIFRGQNHNLVQSLRKGAILKPVVALAMKGQPRKLRLLLEDHFNVIRREFIEDTPKDTPHQ